MQPRLIPERYLVPIQSRQAPPTPYEDLLGDAIERIYAAGIHDLPGVIAALNASGPSGPNGEPWTEATFISEFERLGA